ncbi:dethiobiotin synthase [Nocardioides antri]|uniref:ATP-dependent dethiobiotin synthetase BioD n=1 Tax=Nocardioides antri TaxID=2607659 RepID=A0A5B1M181_9ACTN|nr:dethiobiotin synthase [Nocardioides antri]KAA1425577.1 ATP-dependent dethiobiotin synthetase BioD [Nocardioides antri]
MTRRRVVVVTGTDTGVGKTIATAALAATTAGDVVVVKPVQTGIADEPDRDVGTVQRLTGRPVEEYVALDDPLAPDTAARRQGVAIPPVSEHVERIRSLTDRHDTVLVEGAGGLLVRLDTDGGTLLDLAAALARTLPADVRLEVVVVCRAGLGTLNHTELTVGALRARGIEPAGLVIGSWPAEPGLAETCNRTDLPRVTGVPVLAVLPEGVGGMSRDEFVAAAPRWLGAEGSERSVGGHPFPAGPECA